MSVIRQIPPKFISEILGRDDVLSIVSEYDMINDMLLMAVRLKKGFTVKANAKTEGELFKIILRNLP